MRAVWRGIAPAPRAQRRARGGKSARFQTLQYIVYCLHAPVRDRTAAAASIVSQAPRRTSRAAVLGLVYPPTCIACQGATGAPHALCAACWSGIRFIERPYCERLGTPFAVDLGMPLLSPAAIADPPVFDRARAVAEYDGAASALVHRLKYGDRLELARALGSHDGPGGRRTPRREPTSSCPCRCIASACGGGGSTRRWRFRRSSRGRAACRAIRFFSPGSSARAGRSG